MVLRRACGERGFEKKEGGLIQRSHENRNDLKLPPPLLPLLRLAPLAVPVGCAPKVRLPSRGRNGVRQNSVLSGALQNALNQGGLKGEAEAMSGGGREKRAAPPAPTPT